MDLSSESRVKLLYRDGAVFFVRHLDDDLNCLLDSADEFTEKKEIDMLLYHCMINRFVLLIWQGPTSSSPHIAVLVCRGTARSANVDVPS